MAAITIPVGISIVSWIGATTTLSTASWFNSTNINGIYKQSSNRLSYISCKPGASFPGFTQLIPATAGQVLSGYIFNVKTAFQLDDTQIAVLAGPVTNPVVLATPTNTQAIAASTTVLTVTANSVANATGYQLYNSASQNGTYVTLGGVLSSPSYSHTGLSAGLTQWYKWMAIGNGTTYTNSVLSAVFSGTTQNSGTQPISYIVSMSGQSNMQGLAPRSELFTGTFKDVTPSFTRQYQKAKVWNPKTNQLENLQVGSAGLATAPPSPTLGNDQGQEFPEAPTNYENGFGYMIPLAQQFELQHPTGDVEICFAEASRGATGIENFQPGAVIGDEHLFDELHDRFNALVANRTAAGRQVIHLAHLFFQGEANNESTTYAADMTNLVAAYRSQIFTPTTKIIASLCKSNATVASQQRIWLAQDTNGVIIETDEATRIFDSLHMDAKSIVNMGMGPVYNNLFGTNVTAPVPASLPGGYIWMTYHKSYLPGAAADRWKNYAGRTSDFDLIQTDPGKQMLLTTGRNGMPCFRGDGSIKYFQTQAPEHNNHVSFIVAVDLVDNGSWQGIADANLYLMAGGATNGDIFDGHSFHSKDSTTNDNHLKHAVGKICIITYVFGRGADNSYIRLDGNEVWRGETKVDDLYALSIGKTGGLYMTGDIYAFLATQRVLSSAEALVVENQLASELGVTFTPAPIPTGPGAYFSNLGVLIPDDWTLDVNPSNHWKNDNLVYAQGPSTILHGSFVLTDTRTVNFWNNISSGNGVGVLKITGQPDVVLNQNAGSGPEITQNLAYSVSLPTGTYQYSYGIQAGETRYISLSGIEII